MCFEFVACINFLELILFFSASRVRVVPYKFHANAHFLCAPHQFHPIRYPILCKQMMPLGVVLQLPACCRSSLPQSLLGLRSSVCRIDQLPVGLKRSRSGISFDSSTLWQPPAAVPLSTAPLSAVFICCARNAGELLTQLFLPAGETFVSTLLLIPLFLLLLLCHCLWAIFNYLYYVSVTLRGASLITLHNESVDSQHHDALSKYLSTAEVMVTQLAT